MLAHGIHATTCTQSVLLASASTSTAASPFSTAAFSHRTSLVHHQCPTHKFSPIAGLYGSIGRCIVGEFGEPKSPGLAGELIAYDLNGVSGNASLREKVLKLRLAGLIGQVTDK
jgi:hypothetical protein